MGCTSPFRIKDAHPLFFNAFNTFIRPIPILAQIWRCLADLEHPFGSFVGSNAYLTPGGTQGFAPHYDDIEVMVKLPGGWFGEGGQDLLPRVWEGDI